ncbi:MAG TPA: DUF1501 domain-containing protein, partial [Planctomycetaceae bacterium]|nr:DUF1501 domain-containing protein [Planctomycetaceae bacterium]
MPLSPWWAADWTRRQWLQRGAFGVLGASLPMWSARLAHASDSGGPVAPRAKRVLVILEQGGMSHMDTWDPKPELPVDHRSPHQPIDTRVPGIQVTDLLPLTSQVMHKLAIVRSFRHTKGGADAHPNGTQYVLSGAHPTSPQVMPDIGCIVSKVLGTACDALPAYIMAPGNNEQNAETRTGFLPQAFKVYKTGGSDLSDPKWRVADLLPRGENGPDRLEGRKSLLASLDSHFLHAPASAPSVGGMDRFYEQAFDTLTSAQVTRAFDLQSEPAHVRQRYGEGHRGACYLIGRKLVESDVRFVTVDTRWPHMAGKPGGGNLNWDHHDHIYASGTCELPGASGAGAGRYGIGHWVMMGSVDRAFSALIEDLDQRGLLDETLVCFVTEFGRTPKVNQHGGRDHWTNAYSMVFAGAGVRGGQVIGLTDREGGYVLSKGYTPEDYAATIYEKLGIDRDRPLYTEANRPVFFGHLGEPIA